MQTSNFAVFILTHGRPDNVKTYNTLKKQGYTGRIVFVLDDMDKSIDSYKAKYSDVEYFVFDKKKYHSLTDTADNTGNLKAVVYARNACFDIAKELSIDYFLVLDDDYVIFDYRSDQENTYKYKKIEKLDNVFKIFVEFLHKTPTTCIAFAQGGDFIGGQNGTFGKKIELHRKCMNSFFCRSDRPFEFYGLINEDVNMYTLRGSRGELFFTSSHINLTQTQTQANNGGLTTIYLELGTYVKSFYSVLYHPSSIKVAEMQTEHSRLHHRVKRDLTYPKILDEKHKKL